MTRAPSTQLDRSVQRSIGAAAAEARSGYRWLRDFAPNAFASTLREDAAILASLAAEIATTLVYRRALEPDFGAALQDYVQQMFP